MRRSRGWTSRDLAPRNKSRFEAFWAVVFTSDRPWSLATTYDP